MFTGNEVERRTTPVENYKLLYLIIKNCRGLLQVSESFYTVLVLRHLSTGWWVATGLVLISGVTKSICSLEQLLCQKDKKWRRRTRGKSSHIFLNLKTIYLLAFPKVLKEKNGCLDTVNINNIFRIKIKLPSVNCNKHVVLRQYMLKTVLWTTNVTAKK